MMRSIPAIALVAVLTVAPIATCVLAVQAHDATAMARGNDCGGQQADQSSRFCATQMVAASGPSFAVAIAVALPAHAGIVRSMPDVLARITIPAHDTGPLGLRPPAWLRHNAFLI